MHCIVNFYNAGIVTHDSKTSEFFNCNAGVVGSRLERFSK
jgi:hypothetical protein